ncbi:hypothetical protein [Prauserella rugosa]|uniref:Uncharacterized protein n=1 Tax=Prauserella rugosa TaxID=43354 RepID=A0A660CCE6_9PSEU|nr:hypothetical protein [Prauserella rugosa]KID29412.1 hypothetical protein HQ32_03288 [Prauserella sp. Am3]KMS85425.1 hypothetical protein ACZ91_42405 [Streptomyces regensis]TWH21228.1 hypothetical protein JD82_03083 [Prauserella rugosa]
METWRIFATALLGVSGLLTVLIVMARVREKTGRWQAVAVAALVGVTALLLTCVLMLTTLPADVSWWLAGGLTVFVAVLAFAS